MASNQVSSFEVNNYKSIKSSGEIDIGGISVILGPNSSGKTNILEPLLLMKQSMRNPGLDLNLNGDIVKLGEYKDISHRQEVENEIIYRFNFEGSNRKSNSDAPLSCPVCGKGYKETGWYTKHIKREHAAFWEYTGGEITEYEKHPVEPPTIEVCYSFDTSSRSNHLDYIEFRNPIVIGALYLEKIKVSFDDGLVRFAAFDMHGRLVLNLAHDKEDLLNTRISDFADLQDAIGQLLNSFAQNRYLRFPRYTKNQPYIADQYIPLAESYSEEIQEILGSYKGEGEGEELSIKQGEVDLEGLSRGLLNRLGTITELASDRLHDVEGFIENISHVGPLRRNPQRIYFGSGGSPQETYSQGVDIEERIFRDRQSEPTPIIEKTNEWLQETGFDCELEIDTVGVGDIYQLKVIEDGISVNLADSGFGLSQTLPIIVECVNMGLKRTEDQDPDRNNRRRFNRVFGRESADKQYLTIIEEPEIHLNPRIEAAMADFFIKVNEDSTGLLIETHSEHILNRIQRRVADGTIDNMDDVCVYFVSKDGIESDIRKIEMDNHGSFTDWPTGFFQEDFDDAVEMIKSSIDKGEE